MLQTTTSGHRTRGDKVVQRQGIERTECTPWTLHGLVDGFGGRINCVWVITSGPSILDVVLCLELLEALCVGIVDILGVGNKLRRRSVGSRHFDVEDGLMV